MSPTVWLTWRVFSWGGERDMELIGVSISKEIAENVGTSFRNYERVTKEHKDIWTRGDTLEIEIDEWEVRGLGVAS